MEYDWFASYECKENGVPVKASGIFSTSTNVVSDAYNQVVMAIEGTGKITDLWVISFNRVQLSLLVIEVAYGDLFCLRNY